MLDGEFYFYFLSSENILKRQVNVSKTGGNLITYCGITIFLNIFKRLCFVIYLYVFFLCIFCDSFR